MGRLGIAHKWLKELFGAKGDGFGRFDFSVLRALMMLAAVDGEISDEETGNFMATAEKCDGYDADAFGRLWDESLRDARKLVEVAKAGDQAALVAEFVRVCEPDFVREVAEGVRFDRANAIHKLVQQARADGEYSANERACIDALAKRVEEVRYRSSCSRYSRGSMF